MTEEIIIDGVNVAGCEYYSDIDETCRELNGKYEINECDFMKCNSQNCYYKQLKRLEQERDELKFENDRYKQLLKGCPTEDEDCGFCVIDEQNKRLKQENKELKKQIESQKGLITVGGKQQYEYLQKIDELEQENRELKAYKDVNEDFKKAWDELNKKYYEVLKLAKENADSNEYCLQELEKENKELKEEKLYRGIDRQFVEDANDRLYFEAEKYRKALDTIQRMILSAWEQGKYLDGGLYNDLINEFTKINEVLQWKKTIG